MLTQTLLNKKRTVQLWQDDQNQKKKFFYDFTYMKRECMHTNIYIFSQQRVRFLCGKKDVMNVFGYRKNSTCELEYSVYEKEKNVSKSLLLKCDDRIIRYDFVVSCPKIYGTL